MAYDYVYVCFVMLEDVVAVSQMCRLSHEGHIFTVVFDLR